MIIDSICTDCNKLLAFGKTNHICTWHLKDKKISHEDFIKLHPKFNQLENLEILI